jgi:dihydrodipicolinate synthase/N-acetylneuraminate lyase
MNYLRTLGRDFSLFIPINTMMPGMLVGVRGSIAAGTPVTVPESGVELVKAIWAKNYDLALKIQTLILEHTDRLAVLRQYGRRTTLEGLRLRGIPVKEYPRWPTREMSAEHLKLYETNMKRILEELHGLTGTKAAAE